MILPVVGSAPYGRQTGHLSTPSHLSRQGGGGGPAGRRNIQSFFVSDALRQDLAKRTLALYSADADPDKPTPAAPVQVHRPSLGGQSPTGPITTRSLECPRLLLLLKVKILISVGIGSLQVGAYHSLQLLEAPPREQRAGRVFGYATTVFRATSSVDGAPYALR